MSDWQIALETVACPLCGSTISPTLVFWGVDRNLHLPGNFALVRCAECHLIHVNPRVPSSEIWRYYPGLYYSALATSAQPEKSPGRFHQGVRKRFMRLRMEAMGLFYSDSTNSQSSFFQRALLSIFSRTKFFRSDPTRLHGNGRTVLDIGCGAGAYLSRMRSLGWSCYGFEPNSIGADLCRRSGLDVRTAPQFSWELYQREFADLVTMWQVFEHIPDPLSILEEIWKVLRPDGWLVIGVPNFRSVAANLFRSYWYGAESPRHYILYTPQTLRRALNAARFTCEALYCLSSTSGFTGSLEYLLRDRFGASIEKDQLRKNPFLSRLSLPLVRSLDWLGLGDNMYALARKH